MSHRQDSTNRLRVCKEALTHPSGAGTSKDGLFASPNYHVTFGWAGENALDVALKIPLAAGLERKYGAKEWIAAGG